MFKNAIHCIFFYGHPPRCSTPGSQRWMHPMDQLRVEVGVICKTDASVEALLEEMTALRKSVSQVVLDLRPTAPVGILPPPLVTATKAPADNPVAIRSPARKGTTWNQVAGGLNSQLSTRSRVRLSHPSPTQVLNCILYSRGGGSWWVGWGDGFHYHHVVGEASNASHHLAKMNFPSFDSENPKLWIGS